MTEGMAATLLVIAEVGSALILAFAVTAGLLLWRRRRERDAVDQLLGQVTALHNTQRVTLNGWLTQSFGYDQAEAERLADRALAAESDLYRQLVAAIHDRDPDSITALTAKVDALTFIYRNLPLSSPSAPDDQIEFVPAEADATGPDEADEQPEPHGADDEAPANPESAGTGEEQAVAESAAGLAPPGPDEDPGGDAVIPSDDRERTYSDADDIEGHGPLDDLLDSPEEPVKEPPVNR